MRRKFFIITFFIISVILVFIFHFNKSHDDSRIIIQFATWGSESEISILKPLLKNFEAKNPDIKVNFMHIPQNYFQKIHLLFASNTAPDVIFLNNQYLPIYVNANVLEDLSNYDFEFDKFHKKSIDAFSMDNKIYAVPRDVSNLVIFYNKDIFKKYNVNLPKSGWSLNDFLITAQKLSHPPYVYGISFEEEPLFYLPYITAFGGWTKEDTNNYLKNDISKNKNIMSGLNFYANLRKKYHVAPYKHEIASATMAQMFLQGKLGMHLSGRWLVPKYRQDAKFDWDIIEFPSGLEGKNSLPLDASGWSIAKSSTHKSEAARLIKYLSSDYAISEFTKSGLIVPARIKVLNSNIFLDNKKPNNAQAFISALDNSEPTPVTVNYREIISSLKNKTEYLFNDF